MPAGIVTTVTLTPILACMRTKKPKFHKERPPDQRGVDITQRLFIAIPMPPHVQQHIGRLTGMLASHDWPVRWVGAESAHLTLHFLGETEPERGELLRLALGATVAKNSGFSLETSGFGVFPEPRQPRVLWVGLKGETENLRQLHMSVGKHLAQLDFDVDVSRLFPHVTLGRVRDNPPPTLGAAVQRAYADPALIEAAAETGGPFDVTEVLLVRSLLVRGGSTHETLARFKLGPRVEIEEPPAPTS